MRYFICPNCTTRALDDDGKAGLTHQPVGCAKCGFGYLFELLEDFFPPAGAGMVTCDQEGRVLSCGKGVFEVSGYAEGDVMGKPLVEAFGLSGFADDKDPVPGRPRMGRPKARPARDDAAPLRAAQAGPARPLPRLRRGRRDAGVARARDERAAAGRELAGRLGPELALDERLEPLDALELADAALQQAPLGRRIGLRRARRAPRGRRRRGCRARPARPPRSRPRRCAAGRRRCRRGAARRGGRGGRRRARARGGPFAQHAPDDRHATTPAGSDSVTTPSRPEVGNLVPLRGAATGRGRTTAQSWQRGVREWQTRRPWKMRTSVTSSQRSRG